ncbi:hypothetical protein VNO78_15118 [Psophocarpus tetragonolobus]|uniref:F-box domain-containing protein n=1 Tax=Psophocarpus tetragonolobus TaxID=3891 RepID=A0AAN9XJK2_PSOTE
MDTNFKGIESLTDEVLGEILHRLPYRFLIQCKSISKQFLRVISDPSLLNPGHRCHNQSLPTTFETHTQFLLFHFHFNSGSNYDKIMLLSVDSNNKTHVLRGSDFLPRCWAQDCDRVRVRAAHHDLVLCSTHKDSYTHYFVCNPFTKQFVALPSIKKSHGKELVRVGFICDQSRSRFRVLHIPIDCFKYVSKFKVNMFSSETAEWAAFNVNIPGGEMLMSNSCSRNILVYNGKLVWWMKERGFFVCDPFNGGDSIWHIAPMSSLCPLIEGSQWDIHTGICDGRIKTCVFSKSVSDSVIYRLVNLEQGKWSVGHYKFEARGIGIHNMNLLAFHPDCGYKMYFHSKKGVFLCDYENRKMDCVFKTPEGEDIRILDNVMSLVLSGRPTTVPTLNTTKLQQ